MRLKASSLIVLHELHVIDGGTNRDAVYFAWAEEDNEWADRPWRAGAPGDACPLAFLPLSLRESLEMRSAPGDLPVKEQVRTGDP